MVFLLTTVFMFQKLLIPYRFDKERIGSVREVQGGDWGGDRGGGQWGGKGGAKEGGRGGEGEPRNTEGTRRIPQEKIK